MTGKKYRVNNFQLIDTQYGKKVSATIDNKLQIVCKVDMQK